MRRRIFSVAVILAIGIASLSFLTAWMSPSPGIDERHMRESAEKTMLLLQKSCYVFTNNAALKCASCHHNTLAAMATEIARKKGVPVVDSLSKMNVACMEYTLRFAQNPNKIPEFVPANFITPYILLGLSAEHYAPSAYTDIAVDLLASQARADGSFLTESGRVPLETGDVHLAATAIRAISLYASPAKKHAVDKLVSNTRQWLEKQQPATQQEIAFQLMGEEWCGSNENEKSKVAARLKAMQNPDGGWSQLTTLASDAYATGQALYALFESGMMKPGDAVYRKGLNYLLKTQDKSGAWIVATRSYPIQPFVDSQFPPYNHDQFISAAATSWSIMAVMNALPDAK